MNRETHRFVRHLFRGLPIVVFFATAGIPAIATAEPEHSEPEEETAATLYDKGVLLVEEMRYLEALAAFEASFRINAIAETLFHIAMCQWKLERLNAAVKSFEKILEMALPSTSSVVLENAEAAIRDIETQYGKLSFTNLNPASVVTIDETVVAAVVIDGPFVLEPGSHTVTISSPDCETLTQTVEIEKGRTSVVFGALRLKQSVLRLECPADAAVYLDDVPAGVCPFEAQLEPGERTVTVSAKGNHPWKDRVGLEPGERKTIVVTLEPLPVEKRPGKGLRIGGIASVVVGVAGLCVGVAFTVRYNRHGDEIVALIDKANQARQDDDYELYAQYVSEYQTAYRDLQDNLNPADHAGMAAGYAAGGLLTAAGIALLTVDAIKRRETRLTISPKWGGIAVSF